MHTIHFRADDDETATRVATVLEALGYQPVREHQPEPARPPIEWAVNRAATKHKLTDRERDVLTALVVDKPRDQIAEELGIAVHTVKWHTANIFAKLNVVSRAGLLLYVYSFIVDNHSRSE